MSRRLPGAVALALLLGAPLAAEEPFFTPDFPPDEFAARRNALYDALGPDGLALVPGAALPAAYVPFRQSNDFYWLSGIESPNAYLLLDAGRRKAAVYLPHRREGRERSEGPLFSAEDDELLRQRSGIDAVRPVELLFEDLAARGRGGEEVELHVPLLPAEGMSMSRDLALRSVADAAADPGDGAGSREGRLVALLRERYPWVVVRNLTPRLDALRLVKSPRERDMIRRASRLSGLAILEAMRSTEPGVYEHELDAVARFVFRRHGARGEAYYPLVASGPSATRPHYHAGRRKLQPGELVLVDAAPDLGSYVSDLTRMWPADGRFSAWQREIYGFYLACYRSILAEMKPGDTPGAIMARAADAMDRILAGTTFTRPHYRKAAEEFVRGYRASAPRLGHGVGMAAHDVAIGEGPLRPGTVFTIEPALRVPEEQLYIRLEDLLIVGEKEVEVVSAWLPSEIGAIEAAIAEPGLLQQSRRDAQVAPER